MFKKVLAVIVSVCLSFSLFSLLAFPAEAVQNIQETENGTANLSIEKVSQVLSNSSNYFTENRGQWPEEILYIGQTDFGKIMFTQDAVYYQLIKTTCISSDIPSSSEIESQTIKLSFVNAQTPTIQGKTLLPHYSNYFIGNDQNHWGIHCNNYAQVNYTNVWDNIDLSYFFTPQGMKYEYYVHPGADIQDLQVQVIGADLLSNKHCLELFTSLGNLKDDQLLVYGQNSQSPIQASFKVDGDLFTFDVEDAETCDETIVIDPIVYSTFLGGSDTELCRSISVDKYGDVYVTGETTSADFSVTVTENGNLVPGYDQTFGMSWDGFVVKLNSSGTELQYSTYLGGNNIDYSYGIAVDEFCNAYLTGRTYSSDFPVTATEDGPLSSGYNQIMDGPCDTFAVKLNSSGTELLYSTFVGGSGMDSGEAICLDNSGNAYIVGYTSSSNFPIDQTVGGAQAPGYDQTFRGGIDAFVVKLNSSGTELIYSTYLGGNNWDMAYDIAVDTTGNAYIVGSTRSSDFPIDQTVGGVPAPGYDHTFNGGTYDVFAVKLNSHGTELLYSTYLGGVQSDECFGVTVDASGNAFLTGTTHSDDFPIDQTVGGVSAPGYDHTFNGYSDAFAVKLNSSGTELLYSTYFGGSSWDNSRCIAVDRFGNAYITGETYSADFPVDQMEGGEISLGYSQSYSGAYDAFLIKLNPLGDQLSYSTFLGGSENDGCASISIEDSGLAYVGGYTCSANFPMSKTDGGTPAPGYDKSYNGGYSDSFVAKIATSPPDLNLEATLNKSSYQFEDTVILGVTVSNAYGYAIGAELNIQLPSEFLYLSCTDYPVIQNGQNLSITLGDVDFEEVMTLDIEIEVTKEIQTQRSVPIILELNTNYCDSSVKKVVSASLVPPSCPELYLEATPNKPSYQYGDLVYLNITLRNLGGNATGVELDIELPRELSLSGCDEYRVSMSGNNLSIAIGNLDAGEVISFVLLLEVTTAVTIQKSVPIILELSAKECDSYVKRIVQIRLEPARTGKQELGVSLKLLNLEFDDETGKYYLPFDQALELQLQVTGYQQSYSYDVQWGDGETTTVKKETSSTILQKHKFTARGSMRLQITVTDINGRTKTSTLYVTVR